VRRRRWSKRPQRETRNEQTSRHRPVRRIVRAAARCLQQQPELDAAGAAQHAGRHAQQPADPAQLEPPRPAQLVAVISLVVAVISLVVTVISIVVVARLAPPFRRSRQSRQPVQL
jgi:hypothetical protein